MRPMGKRIGAAGVVWLVSVVALVWLWWYWVEAQPAVCFHDCSGPSATMIGLTALFAVGTVATGFRLRRRNRRGEALTVGLLALPVPVLLPLLTTWFWPYPVFHLFIVLIGLPWLLVAMAVSLLLFWLGTALARVRR
jgi:cobalamin synthase